MKIDLKDKKTRVSLVIVAVIILPILWNTGKSMIVGLMSAYQMSLPKNVEVATPVEKEIEPTFETVGRIEADKSINIIARVDGWLENKYFNDGDNVKKGQKLFQIQPEEYRLAMQDAAARVSENQAVYKNAVIDYGRAAELIKDEMVSREYYDNSVANRNRTKAALDAANAQYKKARLNLSYTTITAPLDGRIGKSIISEGNYVTSSSGPLTTIYQTSPMRVNFAIKSSEYIKIKKYFNENKDGRRLEDVIDVKLKLADGSVYDKIGKLEFSDNKIDEEMGTVAFRALFDNPAEILMPGDYVNVVLVVKKPEKVMLIPQSATKTDVGTGYYVWAIEDGKAVKKDIVVNYNINNNWIVEEGLKPTDKIVVKGIQDIYKTGQPVKPTEIIIDANILKDDVKTEAKGANNDK